MKSPYCNKSVMLTVLVLVSLSLPRWVTSSEPQLSFTVTTDVTFTCTMAGFSHRLDMLLGLQIVKQSADDKGTDIVLATVDSSVAEASRHLRQVHPSHKISGRLRQRQAMDAWLQLTIPAFPPEENGTYSCQIHFMDHPADSEHSTWKADVYVDLSLIHI